MKYDTLKISQDITSGISNPLCLMYHMIMFST